jgi:hypothetical protein
MSQPAPGRVLFLLTLAGLALPACDGARESSAPPSASTQLAASSPPAIATPVEPVELWFGGDVHWGKGRDVAARLALLGERLRSATGFVNLEGPLSAGAGPGASIDANNKVMLSNEAAFLPALVGAGARFIGIANNHADDLGASSVETTRQLLREGGLEAVGLSAGTSSLEHDGQPLHFAAYDLLTIAPAERSRELAALGRKPGLMIVAFHDTGPPSYLPSARLRTAVDEAIELGADVVVSHGTHALAPVERRGPAVIAWGLGNLLFDCSCTRERDGLILSVRSSSAGLEATVLPIDAGLGDAPVQLSHDPALIFDLLEAIGSSPLVRKGERAGF